MSTVNINNTDNQVTAVNANQSIIITDNGSTTHTSVTVTQPVTSVVLVNALGPIGPQGPSGSGGGGTIDTSSFVTTSSFNAFTGSYQVDSSSFNTKINSLTLATSSYVLNSQTSSFVTNSQTSSFVTTSSFNAFTGSYNTGSFTGSFTGSLFGTASWAFSSSQALTASYVANVVTFPYTGSAIITGSLIVTGSINATSITSSLFGTASWAQSASQALTASFLPVATYQITSSWAVSASRAITSSYVTGSIFTSTNPALSASYALTASYALNGGNTLPSSPDRSIQFNSGSTFGGDSKLIFDSEDNLKTARLNVTGRLILEGMIAINDSDSPYIVDRDISIILCDTSTGPIELDISSNAIRGRILTIKDIGNASSNNITFGSSTIDGGAFIAITNDKQSIIIAYNVGYGTWYIIGSHN